MLGTYVTDMFQQKHLGNFKYFMSFEKGVGGGVRIGCQRHTKEDVTEPHTQYLRQKFLACAKVSTWVRELVWFRSIWRKVRVRYAIKNSYHKNLTSYAQSGSGCSHRI